MCNFPNLRLAAVLRAVGSMEILNGAWTALLTTRNQYAICLLWPRQRSLGNFLQTLQTGLNHFTNTNRIPVTCSDTHSNRCMLNVYVDVGPCVCVRRYSDLRCCQCSSFRKYYCSVDFILKWMLHLPADSEPKRKHWLIDWQNGNFINLLLVIQ